MFWSTLFTIVGKLIVLAILITCIYMLIDMHFDGYDNPKRTFWG